MKVNDNYFLAGSAGLFAGAFVAGTFILISSSLTPALLAVEDHIAEERETTKSTIISPQVTFSSKSVVWRAPISWLAPLNWLVSPPPFEFCNKTTNISSIATIIVKIIINVIVLVNFFVKFIYFVICEDTNNGTFKFKKIKSQIL